MQNKLSLRFGCSCAFVPFSEFEKGALFCGLQYKITF
jgi:hypothetical protein